MIRVVDGDTVDVDINLGFGVWLKDERVRIIGIDTPESRTSDKIEKLFGIVAKRKLRELLENGAKLITIEDNHGEDMKGKFGRILGDFRLPNGEKVTDILIKENYCVPYNGESKDDLRSQHIANRFKLLERGVVNFETYNKIKIKFDTH